MTSQVTAPQEIGAASLGIWLVSDVIATTTGVSGAVVAVALCLLVSASEVGRRPRQIMSALALAGTLFTSATGANSIASSVSVVEPAQAQQSDPTPEPTRRVIKPWFATG